MTDDRRDEDDINTPYARPIEEADGTVDQLEPSDRKAKDRQEALVDESIEETFPASDPATPKRIT